MKRYLLRSFRRHFARHFSRHLYLANCGGGCGDTSEDVLRRLQAASEVLALHVGEGGVSYASFADEDTAQRVKESLKHLTFTSLYIILIL